LSGCSIRRTADGYRLGRLLVVPVGERRNLYLLCRRADADVLPPADFLEGCIELAGAGLRVHAILYSSPIYWPLLENANAVMVGSDCIVRVIERLRHLRVGVHTDVRFDNSSGDGHLASADWESVAVSNLSDDAGMSGLDRVETRKVTAAPTNSTALNIVGTWTEIGGIGGAGAGRSRLANASDAL